MNYDAFDHPSITNLLFYPRKQDGPSLEGESVISISIEVDPKVAVSGRVFWSGNESPAILFFHGNGEIVTDYDDFGVVLKRMGITFMPVEYRGYGASGGAPTVSSMMRDCHAIYRYAHRWLADRGHTGPFIVMGRSLGSASAIELASTYQDEIHGLIIESGFAYVLPLLRLIGADPDRLGLREEGFSHLRKIASVRVPTLIIHARQDHIIPYTDGLALHEASGASWKRIVTIEGADHNTIFMYGLHDYVAGMRELIRQIQER